MNFHVAVGWTDERIEKLKKLNIDGLSASQIARELGGFAHCADGGRCAVIGKLTRLNITSAKRYVNGGQLARKARKFPKTSTTFRYAPKIQTSPRDTAARKAVAAEKADELENETVVELTIEQRARTVTLMDLGKYQCRWPLGHPGKPDFCFCGDMVAEAKPYCTPHWRRAHEKALKRA